MKGLSRDGRLLFAARMARMFGYGFLAVVLALYLAALGLDEWRIGLLLTLTLVGDTVVSLWMSTQADRYGRRTMLVVGSLLLLGAGLVFISTDRFLILLVAATIGVISPSGYEVGPFLAIEQAALSQAVPDDQRTHVFAWYNLAGSFATAVGSLTGGGIARLGQTWGLTPLASYRVVLAGYAVVGVALAWFFWRLSPPCEVPPSPGRQSPATSRSRLGLHHSGGVVLRLSGLFALDAFGGGFVIQSMLAYWFYLRFGTDEATLGAIFFGANVLAGVSALTASGSRPGSAWSTRWFSPIFRPTSSCCSSRSCRRCPWRSWSCSSVQHLPDGRAHAAVVHDGHRPPRGALRSGRHHRHRPHCRRRGRPGLHRLPARRTCPDERLLSFWPGVSRSSTTSFSCGASDG